MRQLKKRERTDRLAGVRRITTAANGVMASAAALTSGLFLHETMAADGRDALDLGLSSLLSGGLLLGTLAVHHWGIHYLARTPETKRKSMMAPYWAGASVIAMISMGTGIPYVAGPGALEASFTRQLEEVTDDTKRYSEGFTRAISIEKLLTNAQASAETLLASEQANGALCGKGGGPGPCVSILENVVVNTEDGRTALSEAKADAAPVLREIEALQAKIERVANSERMSVALKMQELQASIESLRLILNKLHNLIPVGVLETAMAAFEKPWDRLGVPDLAASRLRAEFGPYGQQIEAEIAAIIEALGEPLSSFKAKSELQIIGEEFASVAFVVCLVAALDLIPLLLIGLFMAAAPKDDDDDQDPPYGAVRADASVTGNNPDAASVFTGPRPAATATRAKVGEG